MFVNKSFSFWSVLLSVGGALLLITTYLISPAEPQGLIVIFIKIFLVLALILLAFGIITSILAIKKKEEGVQKYIGILLPVLIILFVVLLPILMGIGFILNDKP